MFYKTTDKIRKHGLTVNITQQTKLSNSAPTKICQCNNSYLSVFQQQSVSAPTATVIRGDFGRQGEFGRFGKSFYLF